MLLRCILEIILLSFQPMMTGFIPVNLISKFLVKWMKITKGILFNTKSYSIQEIKMLLRCILEIILPSFQIMMKGFISVNRIRNFFSKLAEDDKRNIIEVLNYLQTVG